MRKYNFRPVADPKQNGKRRVNLTDHLTWIESANGKGIPASTLRTLERYDMVRWVARLYKSESSPNGLK